MKSFFNKLSVVVALVMFSISVRSQTQLNNQKPEHQIVFQLTSGDTTAHKQLIKQFSNILSVSPTTKIEVVCHGAGLDMLLSGKTIVEEKIKILKANDVS